MVKIRLTRMGRKKRPFYRIIAIDSRKRRDGAYIEKVGTYNPVAHTEEEITVLDHELAIKWLMNGAQPTRTVASILRKEGVLLKYDMLNRTKKEKVVTTKDGKEVVKYKSVTDENGNLVRQFSDADIEKAFAAWQTAQEAKREKALVKKAGKLSKKAKAKLEEEAQAKSEGESQE